MNSYIEKIIHTTVNGSGDSEQLCAAIFGIALTTRGKRFLELGVREGHTTLPLLAAAKELGATVTSVDIEETTFDCPEDLKPNWNFLKSDAIDFLEKNQTSFDLIFIDDWHDGIHVKKEIDLLEPYCNKNTVVLLHDLMARTHPNYNTDVGYGEFGNGGPFGAVCGLDSDVWEYSTLPFCNGLTILRKY
jgi:predicted O-methyltransferase YrrM